MKTRVAAAALAVVGLAACSPDVTPKNDAAPASMAAKPAPAPAAPEEKKDAAAVPAGEEKKDAAAPATPEAGKAGAATPAPEAKQGEGDKKSN